jgi:transcriptional regulator with XRE-family HTH domain
LDKKFASFLKKKRGDLSYRDFAKRIGIDAATLHRLENNQRSITLTALHPIMTRLKCSFSEIFGEQDAR